jgi:hypothetical protein
VQNKLEYVKVSDIKFITFPNGYVRCILSLSSSVKIQISEKDSIEYEVIKLDRFSDISKLNIYVGQTLLVKFSYSNMNDVSIDIIKSIHNKKAIEIPEKCSSCGSRVIEVHDEYKCSGYMCPSKARTPLFNLFVEVMTELKITISWYQLEAFDRYLDNMPTYNSTAHITNVIDYFRVFNGLGDVSHQGRFDSICSSFLPDYIYEFESWLFSKIQSNYFKDNYSKFWAILPVINEISGIYNVNPSSDMSGQLLRLGADNDNLDFILDNMHHIQELFSNMTC